MLFFYLFLSSLSQFLCLSLLFLLSLSLLFNLFFPLLDFLSNILEEHFHIDIVSRERCQQLVSQSLDLIADNCYLLGERLINFSHLNFNLIPYLMVQSLQFLILLANLEFCLIFNFLNPCCLCLFDSINNIFGLSLTFNGVFVD